MTLSRFSAFRRHGGRLGAAMAAFPSAKLPWVDLSTGINPHYWAGAHADVPALRRLPDPAETQALEAAAAKAFGVADRACVAAVPGAEAGLRLLPRLFGARRAAIVAPTYGGHAEAWLAAGCETRMITLGQNLVDSEALVLVNPNNPDGRTIQSQDLLRMCSEKRWVIVDESFGEVAPELSVAPFASGNLVVLRSFGKFFGLAGVRLGFVVADPRVTDQVRAAFGDWPVCAEAIAAGRAAYADTGWADSMRSQLRDDARRLDQLLMAAGFKLEGGTPLFRLTASPRAGEWFLRLAEAGVLVRPFDDAPSWLRFGLPGDTQEWARLQAVLEQEP